MAFPATPLDIRVMIFIDGAYTDISSDVRTATQNAISVKRGRADEGSHSDVGECTFTLNNRDGKYSPRNPRSPLYGKIGRNTPMQLRLIENGTTYILFTGEISSWPQRWNTPGTDVWVPVTASGILRRLGAGAAPLESTLRRRIPSDPNLVAYWPFEEEEGDSNQAMSPIQGVIPAQVRGFEFGQLDTLPGSKALPALTANAGLTAQLPVWPAGNITKWHVEFVYKLDAMPTTLSRFIQVNTSGGIANISVWVQNNNGTNIRMRAVDQEGNQVFETSHSAPDFNGTWNRFQINATQVGNDVDFHIGWITIGGGSYGINQTANNVRVEPISSISCSWTAFEGMGFGHLGIFNSGEPVTYTDASTGFNGERAITRAVRLCQEEGVPLYIYDSTPAAQSARMGPQRPNTLLNLLEECADADLGFLTERRDGPVSLMYRSPQSVYNQDSKLDLDYALNQVAPPLEPIDDDQHIRNDVTAQRAGGSSTRIVDETSSLSVNPPPLGVGRYDESVTVNVHQDYQTADIAGWHVLLGTWDESRYPVVRVSIGAMPQFLDAVEDIDVWDRIRILNPPPWLPPDPIDLLVQGYSYQLGSYQWDVEFNCTPFGPYDVGVMDDNSKSRADTEGSVTYGATKSETDTELEVYTTDGPKWIVDESLTKNTTFEVDIDGWFGADATIEWAPTPAGVGGHSFQGSGSLKITPVGGQPFPGAESDHFPVEPDTQLRLRCWGLCETTRSVDVNINWYDSNDNYLSTSTINRSMTANTWQYFDGTFTVPGNAGFGAARPTIPAGTPADVFYVDNLAVTPPNAKSPDNFPFDVKMAGEKMTVLSIKDNALDTFTRAPVATVRDAFTRTVASGWGSADTGQDWTATGGVATDYRVDGSSGVHDLTTRNVFRITSLDTVSMTDLDLYTTVTIPVMPTGDGIYTYHLARADVAAGTYYFARLWISTAGAVDLSIRKRTPTETLLGNKVIPGLTHTAGKTYTIRFRVVGSVLYAKVWAPGPGVVEPVDWQVVAMDTDIAGPGAIGVRSYISNTNTNTLPVSIFYDDIIALPAGGGWGVSTSGDTWGYTGGTLMERTTFQGMGAVALSTSPQTFRLQTIGASNLTDCEILCQISPRQVAQTVAYLPGIIFRYQNGTNFYRMRCHFNTDGSISLAVTYGSTQIGSTGSTGLTYSGTEKFWVQARVDGHRVRGKIWEDGRTMPEDVWHIDQTITGTTIDSGPVGISASTFAGGADPLPIIITYDNFRILNPQNFTVMRAQNDVVKQQPPGGDVRLFRPTIITP